MKHIGLGLSLACACAAAGLFAAFALADSPPGGTTTSTATTTTMPVQLAEDVTIGGVPVGGMSPADAASAIRDYFSTPLTLEFGTLTFDADPGQLGAPNVKAAIARARNAETGASVKLVVVVRTARVHAYVATIARRIDRPAAESRLLLRHLRPFLTKELPGRALLRVTAERAITNELRRNARDVVELRTKPILPTVTRKNFGPVIVIHRGSNRLFLFRGARYWRVFPVATGQSVYPTPLGRFQIVVKWRDPWWYPPNDPWAAGEKPTPPGPGNPLGPRWMGLSAPGVGIHGTNNESSIGYSVSHGCIRMHVADALWLFDHVEIGTTVYIVAAA
jgi:lipoprotein-anchoring transpeptidase ErfK/SrfK